MTHRAPLGYLKNQGFPQGLVDQFTTEVEMHCLHLKWILDPLDQLDKDLQCEYARLLPHADPEYADAGDIAAQAIKNVLGADTCIIPDAQKRGAISGYCVVVYHHFERFLEDIVKSMKPPKSKELEKFNLDIFFKCYAQFEKSVHCKKIDELRYVVNYIKHGRGKAERELRKRRPDYFVEHFIHPDFVEHVRELRQEKTLKPLAGDDLRIQSDDFLTYCEAMKSFGREVEQEWGWDPVSGRCPNLAGDAEPGPPPPARSAELAVSRRAAPVRGRTAGWRSGRPRQIRTLPVSASA